MKPGKRTSPSGKTVISVIKVVGTKVYIGYWSGILRGECEWLDMAYVLKKYPNEAPPDAGISRKT